MSTHVKRVITVGIALAGIGLAGIGLAVAPSASIASAKGTATPAVQPVGADFALTQTVAPTTTICPAPNPNGPQQTFTLTGGTWSGTIDDHGSMMHPYPVLGTFDMAGTFVINHDTGTSIFEGTMTVTDTTAPGVTARGPVTLAATVVNWAGDYSAGDVAARGMVDLAFYTGKKLNGTRLIANVEFQLDGATGAISGSLGGSGSAPDFSSEFNGQTTC